MHRKEVCVSLVICFAALSLGGSCSAAARPMPDKSLEDIGFEISANNKGVLLKIARVPEIDPAAAVVDFQLIESNLSRADVMRVMLQSLSRLSVVNPSLVVFARNGSERLLVDGKDVAQIANEYQHGNPLAAWRMLAERAVKPSGERIPLPDNLLARTTASFALVDEVIRESEGPAGPGSSPSTGISQDMATLDPWKPTGENDHGPVVDGIIRRVRLSQLKLNDGRRIDYKQVEGMFQSFLSLYNKALTDYKIALQQREQGDQTEIPPGSSELLELQVLFGELFPTAEDEYLLPLIEDVFIYAPESSFAGLTVYGKKGEIKGRITGKYKIWDSGISRYSVGKSSYTTMLVTDSGLLTRGWSYDANNVRWGDIKNRIAFDNSRSKREEDRRLELEALQRR